MTAVRTVPRDKDAEVREVTAQLSGLLAELREEMGLNPNPLAAYAASGYAEKIIAERVGGTQAGWGA